MRKLYKSFCDYWTSFRLTILFITLAVITMLPLIYCSFYDYATGDDLGYSATIHQLMVGGSSLCEILQSMWETVVASWYTYQGTWSSILLFQLQPGLLGERAYIVTPYIALLCLVGGTGYLLWDLLVRRLHFKKSLYLTIMAILMMLSIQYMPRIRGGMFWYTSVAHYVIPYGAALLCITWAMRWMDTGWKRYYIPMLLLMTYLGGAGYPPIVLATAVFVLIILGACVGLIDPEERDTRYRRALWLVLPLLLELVGFAISAMAPGNKTRGGEDFGFGAARAIGAILTSLQRGITDCVEYCATGRLILVGLVLIAVVAFEAYDVTAHRVNARYPLGVIILTYLVSASVRTPEVYAGVEVSGGVPDVEFFTTLLCLVIAICHSMVWLKNRMVDRQQIWAIDETVWNRRVRTPIMLLTMLFCIVFARHLIGGTVDYTCMTFISSGGLSDFADQMEERLAILMDETIQDVVLPEMNEYQGPIMHMPLTSDPDAFTNYVTREYYGKNSVIAIPREEWNAQYGVQSTE